MPLYLTGLSHKTTPLALRERLSWNPEDIPVALHAISAAGAKGAVLISTCNRTEIIWRGEQPQAVQNWLASINPELAVDVQTSLYQYEDEAAIRHLFRVTSGLDSLVLGEPQVAGQVKQAVAAAREAGTLDPLLGRLFQHAFSTAKRVRSETAVGAGAVSVAWAAVKLAQRIFADFSRRSALLVGAGETIELVARHLREIGVTQIKVVNRDPQRAASLAAEFGGESAGLEQLDDWLPQADIVVSSTASCEPLILASQVKQALAKRKHKPMFLVDLAVPRDIEPATAELRDVFLYSVDDLREMAEEGMQARQTAAAQAELIISDETEVYLEWQRSLQAVDMIRALRESGEAARDASLQKAQRLLAAGSGAEEALHALARELTNKLLHAPTSRLRDAGARDESELLGAASELFDLHDRDSKHRDSKPEHH